MKSKKVKNKDLLRAAKEQGDLGTYLKLAREQVGLSQGDVAKKLKMRQFQSISQWERNASGSVPLNTLLKLIELYELPVDEVYEVLLKYQTQRLEEKLEKKFLGKIKKTGSV